MFAKACRLDPDKLRQAETEFRELEAAGIICRSDLPRSSIIMPFGLRNATQTFQRFMDSLFKHLPFVFCYLDDLIIASHTLEEHHEHLWQIFTIL